MKAVKLFSLILGLIVSGNIYSETGKTVYVPRLLSMDSTYDIAQYDYFRDNNRSRVLPEKPHNGSPLEQKPKPKMEPYRFTLNFTPIYEQSQPSSSMAKALLFNNQTDVLVTQAGGVGTVYANNIYSEWIGLNALPNTFKQSFSFKPQRRVWGGFLNFYGFIDQFWAALIIPVICAQNNAHFSQSKAPYLGIDASVKTVQDALSQSSYKYGRLKNVNEKWGVDDIKIKLGGLYWDSPSFQGRAYFQGLIPTGTTHQADYIFNSRVGSRNWGLGCGHNFFWSFWKDQDLNFALISDVNWVWRFTGHEMRSFDLSSNGSFSRYLLLAQKNAATTPLDGINQLTSKASVNARNAVEALFALHCKHKRLHAEVGYDFFYRQAEDVHFDGNLEKQNLGIFNPGAVTPTGTSSSKATIGTTFIQAATNSDATFVTLTNKDIDNSSAAHNAYLSNKFYASLAGDVQFGRYPALVGVLGSYEVGNTNAALSQWSVAGQIAAKF